MFSSTKIRVVLALLLGVALPVLSPAWAQNAPWKSSDFRVDSGGSGELRFRNRNDDLERTVVNLRRNGRAEVTIYTGRDQIKFDGKWSENSFNSRRARLDLDLRGSFSSFSDEANGTLTLERITTGLLETWRVRRLELSGQDHGYRMRINFDGTRAGNGDGDNDNGNGSGNDGDYDGGSGDFQEHSGESRGSGRIREGRNEQDINRANVRLERNGFAEITFYGDTTLRLTGRWRSVSNNRAEVRIDRYNGRSTERGDGRITFYRKSSRNLDLERVDLSGRTSYGNFSVDFSAGDSGGGDDNGGGWGGSGGFDSSQRGRGTLRLSGQSDPRLSRASVNLDRNGRAQILVEATNGTRYTISGRWSRGRDREFNIIVSSALSYNNATGRGKITLRNDRDFSSIELSGRFGSREWGVEFDAD